MKEKSLLKTKNMTKDVNTLIKEFYSKPYYLSYSGLNKLLYSPGLFFRHYILQQEEDRLESYLVEGKVIHCMLLDDGSFNDHFVIMPTSLPGDNTRTIVDKMYQQYLLDIKAGKISEGRLSDYYKEILAYLKEVNLHQVLADDKKPGKDGRMIKGDQKRLEKIINEETKSYWEFLKIKGKKDIIDNDMLKSCAEAVEAVKADPRACDVLCLYKNELDKVDIFNEQFYQAETDKKFGIKGYPDNLKVDYDKKILYINDLKKTSKTLADFQEAIDTYNYWAQATIYYRLVIFNFVDVLETDWKVVFNFVVIDRYLQVYVFEVREETMAAWQLRLEEKLNEADWHYENRNFTLPFAFATGKILL